MWQTSTVLRTKIKTRCVSLWLNLSLFLLEQRSSSNFSSQKGEIATKCLKYAQLALFDQVWLLSSQFSSLELKKQKSCSKMAPLAEMAIWSSETHLFIEWHAFQIPLIVPTFQIGISAGKSRAWKPRGCLLVSIWTKLWAIFVQSGWERILTWILSKCLHVTDLSCVAH